MESHLVLRDVLRLGSTQSALPEGDTGNPGTVQLPREPPGAVSLASKQDQLTSFRLRILKVEELATPDFHAIGQRGQRNLSPAWPFWTSQTSETHFLHLQSRDHNDNIGEVIGIINYLLKRGQAPSRTHTAGAQTSSSNHHY